MPTQTLPDISDRLRRLLSLSLVILLAGAPWTALGLERGKTPIEVEVSPTTTIAGAPVLISGRSVPLGDKKQIPIQILRPDGARQELSTGLSAAQEFTLSYIDTSEPGEYRVTAFAADRKASVDTSFTVHTPVLLRRDTTRRMTTAFEEIEEETEQFSRTIGEAPASVARDELGERVEGLQRLLADVDKYLDLLDQSVEALEDAIEEDDEDSDKESGGYGSESPGDKPGPKPEASGEGADPKPKPGDSGSKPDGKPAPKPKPPDDGGDSEPLPDTKPKPDGKPAPKPKPPDDGGDSEPLPDTKPKPDSKFDVDPDPEPGSSPPSDDTPSDSDPGDSGDGDSKIKPPGEKPGDSGDGDSKIKPPGEKPGDSGDGDSKIKPPGEKPGDPGDGDSKIKPPGEKPGEGDDGDSKIKPPGEKPGEGDDGDSKIKPPGEKPGESGDGDSKIKPPGEKPPREGEAEARETLLELHQLMARTADKVEEQQLSFTQQLEKFDYDHTLCDGLHYVQQAWASMTAAISATKKLAKAAVEGVAEAAEELAIDSAFSSAGGDAGGTGPEASLVRGQLLDNAKEFATDSWGFFKVAENTAGGLMDYGLERVFRLACEKYVGPIKGTMTAEVFVDGGRFYAYETKIEGELRLRYERGTARTQPVTGEFEGVATSFKLDEDLWRIQPSIEKDVLLRWVMHPLPSVWAGSIGTFARVLTSPNYFLVPVRGIIERDKIKIKLEPARLDFDKSSTAVYVLVNLSVPFPHVMTQEIDHEGAHYILTRALREEPEFDIVVHRDEEYSELQDSFQHDASTPDNKIKVRTQLEVRACNPQCP